MSDRNPSFGLTDGTVDDIVDRLLLGKYEKHRPVGALEVVRTGLIGPGACRNYVVARWGQRSRWESSSGKDGPLSNAGITMRSNKLWERAGGHVSSVKAGTVDSDDLVWRVYDGRSYDTVCYAVGSPGSAKQWAFTLFGWTLREGTVVDNLRVELAGAGGHVAASIANIGQLGGLARQIKDLEDRAAQQIAQAERIRLLHDTIASASAHLAG
jgi:hypothetical protein